jgi:hypothetical protein
MLMTLESQSRFMMIPYLPTRIIIYYFFNTEYSMRHLEGFVSLDSLRTSSG